MDGGKFDQPTLVGLMASQDGREAVEKVLESALAWLQAGKGKFGPDGSFQPKAPTFGIPFEPIHDAHRQVYNSLKETVAYMQGKAFTFYHLDQTGVLPGLQEDDDFSELFDERHWNRSKSLLNTFYKSEAGFGECYMTLSDFTAVAMKNETRNRRTIRDDKAPVFERFGIWAMSIGNTENTWHFTPGPFLLLFHERVLTPFMAQKRDQ